MDVVSMEVEITSSLSPSKLFNVFSDFDTIAPKVIPQVYKSIALIQGDGGVGSIKSVTFHDGATWKLKIDSIDTSEYLFSYTLFESDDLSGIMDTATHHIKFIPSTNGGSVYKHTTLVKCKGDAKLTDDFINLCKEALKNSFNALESYAIDHPNAY
ncbi:putative Bet v I/Major latex protein [Helianthus annuus]|uniref:Bet v I/Major latex protein n=1 Tax=Helianthus annuus TaxID=4232 RepID=A0A251TC09_HELAN|nr:root allergen protein [Helianthus annuus]KAF5781966.1 putative Bet v I/Major latex protein [Helianthus annuus]KAJ0501507.1 putative Bet v I/Major latex protein [Helianthus annuus]KAJ0509310.1 putative Bet v I/Major latex protein [Helianthus annuus]KAJ0517416.1 putative Bet v I/Major latex protein [Helianthus annuus]KAJ0685426.1 putative Bet v I/Major latex protein [Helianthus annuus]